MYFNNKNDVLDWIIVIPCILHFARNANDDRLQDDDDGIQKLEEKSNGRGLNVTLSSLQTRWHLGDRLTLPQR